MKKRVVFLGVMAFSLWNANTASACLCRTLPGQAFDKAQVVFTGKVIKAKKKEWTVYIDRVWKGEMEEVVKLKDAQAGSSCASSFKSGERYLFLISDVKEADGTVVYYVQGCDWTTRLKAHRLDLGEDGSFWLEDLIMNGRGEDSLPIKKKAKSK